jgi:hypothetical protein
MRLFRNRGETPARSALLLCTLMLFALSAQADIVTVDCDGGEANYSSLQAAVNALSPSGPHGILVSGTCVGT